MQKSIFPILPLILVLLLLSGCDFIGDVLEFGFWTGVIVVGLIVLVIWGVMKAFRG
jgi:hypothetical protein